MKPVQTPKDGRKASKMIRVQGKTFERLKQFGELGEPVDAAVSRCLDYAEKGKQVLTQRVTV